MKSMGLVAAVILTPLFLCLTMTAILFSQRNFPPISLSPNVAESVLAQGTVRVLVRLNTPFAPEGRLRPAGVILQRGMIRYVQGQVIEALIELPDTEIIHQYSNTPLLAMRVSRESLSILQSLAGLVLRIDEQCAYLDAALCDFHRQGT